ncbi:MAG: UDP-N-acetylglucosamine 2-epimerase (non-hydrolyzing), partial [Anaerolineae bacterium]|nr:UDP-N-acetylglucosamine 2-epimerase (non-hydrolyzing) [Anaerolineae bacterium]
WAAAQPCPPQVESLLNRFADRVSPIAYRHSQTEIRNPHSAIRNRQSAIRVILVTAHRRESFGEPLRRICIALRQLARRGDVHIIYPVHPNPHVQGPVHELLDDVPRITLLPPVDYLTLVHLMKRSFVILTDSGGIQEEAPGLGVPVLVLREVTERPEAVEAGAARVVGTDPQRILAEAERLLDDPAAHAAMAQAVNPYGDGHAAGRIVAALLPSPFGRGQGEGERAG